MAGHHDRARGWQFKSRDPTSAEICMWGRQLAAMLALYTGKGVTPEVNLKEHISPTPLQSSNKAEITLALKSRGDVTRSPKTGVSVAPQMDMCPTKI